MKDIFISSNIQYKKFYKKVFTFAVILTIIQQFFLNNEFMYNNFRVGIIFIFALLTTLTLKDLIHFYRIDFIKIYLIAIYLSIMMLLIFTTLNTTIYISKIFELLIPFGLILCSLYCNFSKNQINKLLSIYVSFATILGIFIVFYYGNGFELSKIYFFGSKNQVGPILGMSCIILFYNLINYNTYILHSKKMFFVTRISLLFMLLSILLVIRNRAGLLGVIIVCICILLQRLWTKLSLTKILLLNVITLTLVTVLLTGLLDGIILMVWNSFTLNYDISNLNSLSANRLSSFEDALRLIIKSPFWGELTFHTTIVGHPHNYLLNKWTEFGIIGSTPMVLFYIYLWFFVVKEIFKNRKTYENILAMYLLLFALFTSLFEYLHPFGPGVSQIIVWTLLGYYLKNNAVTNSKYNIK